MLHVRPGARLPQPSSCVWRLIKGSPTWHSPRRNLLTLAIETSCDDTAVAILEKDETTNYHKKGALLCAQPDSSPSPGQTINANSHSTGQNDSKNTINNASRAHARLLFNEKITAPNTGLGGIHPIEALESHQTTLAKLIQKAIHSLPDCSVPFRDSPAHSQPRSIHLPGSGSGGGARNVQLPDFISVTRGPGMRSNLQCGLDTAKGLAVAWGVPLLGVHHMQAHALTPRLANALEPKSTINAKGMSQMGSTGPNPSFPFLTLLVSGGHTMLLHSSGLIDHKILATTVDVAIGDALDKAGRMILPEEITKNARDTAFAKHLSDFAFPTESVAEYDLWPIPKRRKDEIQKPVNVYGWQIQTAFAGSRDMAFSFTSVASSVEQILRKRHALHSSEQPEMSSDERRFLAITALGTAFEHLASRTIMALETLTASNQEISTLVVSGGVAANAFLRHFLRAMLDVRGFGHVELSFPPPWLCTDNAAMIAWCGMEMYEAGFRSDLNIKGRRKWSMDSAGSDGGIFGTGG